MARPTDDQEIRANTIGRPFASVSVRLDPTTRGELALSCLSPAAMLGTLESGRLRRSVGWISTGDLAVRRPDGNLVATGRADGVIVRGGRRIDPAPIEAALSVCPGVECVAVVGLPSRLQGELDIVAAVVGDVGLTELQRFARRVLGPGSLPQRFTRVESIPLTADGFPMRASLARRLRSEGEPAGGGDDET